MPFLKDIFDEYEILHEKFRLSLPHYFEDIIPLSLACIVFEEKYTLLFFVCQTFFKNGLKYFIIDFQQFDYDVPWCDSVDLQFTSNLGGNLPLLIQICFLPHTLSSPSDCRYSLLLHIILQGPEALFFF